MRAAAVFATLALVVANPADAAPPKDLDAYAERALASFDTPGMTLAIVEGSAITAKAYGVPFLLKGGQAAGDDLTDGLAWPTGETKVFQARRAPHVDTHGSGCTLSAAITAQLAKGKSLSEAVTIAHAYLQGGIHGPIQVAGLNCIRHL